MPCSAVSQLTNAPAPQIPASWPTTPAQQSVFLQQLANVFAYARDAAGRQGVNVVPTAYAIYNLGAAYDGAGQYAQAIDAYRQALQINPQDTGAWLDLGIAYLLAGQQNQALAIYQHLKTLDPVKAQKLFDLIVPK